MIVNLKKLPGNYIYIYVEMIDGAKFNFANKDV